MPQPEVRKTRAERLAMPLAREVVRDLAVEHGACIRPVQLRRTNLDTGAVEQVLVPCGHTLAAVCPACAERARALRAAQCREGWHLETEPVLEPDEPTEDQKWWVDGYTASHKDGPVKYTAHELRHVCASLLIASGATDMQVTNQMGHSKIETTKNIYGNSRELRRMSEVWTVCRVRSLPESVLAGHATRWLAWVLASASR